jgi:RNA polymerase sigma-70 factor (ECF subfamily)
MIAKRMRKGKETKADAEEVRLIRKAQRNRQAFGELYERYLRKIYTYIYYRTGNHEDAEDLTSRVFQKAYLHLPTYEHQGLPFSAWLYRIAHNMVANWYRDQSRRKVVGLDEGPRHSVEEDPDERMDHSAEREQLLKIVRRLPPERQQIIILKFAEGYSNAEIGDMIGRSEGAVKSLYHRTLLVLREEMRRIQHQNPPQKGKERKRGA